VAEQAEERIWMRVHHAANIGEAQPQDVLKCAPALRHGDCRLGAPGLCVAQA